MLDIYFGLLKLLIAMTVVAVEFDDKTAIELKQLSESLQTDESVLIKKAIDSYLRRQRMDQIRAEIRPYAEVAGFFSEEDIYRDIS